MNSLKDLMDRRTSKSCIAEDRKVVCIAAGPYSPLATISIA